MRAAPFSLLPLLALVLTFTTARPATAQWIYGDAPPGTPASSYARGMADVIRSQGAKNLLDAQAASEAEEARKKYMENRMQATENYFRMKSINRSYREDQRRPRPTSEELFRLARLRAPDRLSPSDLDPVTGNVNWPAVLRDETFDEWRTRLDRMLAYWAENGHRLTIDQHNQLDATIEGATQQLIGIVTEVPANAYAEARRFLESLSYEVQLAQGY